MRALAQSLLLQQKFEDAAAALTDLIQMSRRVGIPNRGLIRSHLELCSCYIALDRLDDAAKALAVAAVELDGVVDKARLPLFIDSLTNKAELAYKRNQLAQAVAAAEEAVGLTEGYRGTPAHPDYWRVVIHLGRLLLDAGRTEEANKRFDVLSSLIAKAAEDGGSRIPLLMTAGSLHRVACIYFDRGTADNYERCDSFLEDALRVFTNRTNSARALPPRIREIFQMLRSDKASLLREQARLLRAGGKTAEAEAKEKQADAFEEEVRKDVEAHRLLTPLATSRCLASREAYIRLPQLTYLLTLAFKRIPPLGAGRNFHVPEGALLDAVFDNPVENGPALSMTHTVTAADLAAGQVSLLPPWSFANLRAHQTCRATVNVWADAGKSQLLGVHHQLFAPSGLSRQLRRPVSE